MKGNCLYTVLTQVALNYVETTVIFKRQKFRKYKSLWEGTIAEEEILLFSNQFKGLHP